MKLVSDRLGSLLGVGESMHVIDLQRMALLRTADLDGTEKRCRRLLVEMRKPIEWSAGRSLVPDVALGVVRAGAGITAARLLRQARVTLEVAKLEGPGCVIRHREAVDDFLKLRRELRAEFPQALDRGAVGLAFEPVVCLHTGAIIGGRTQPRWLHPRLGAVTPRRFGRWPVRLAPPTRWIARSWRWRCMTFAPRCLQARCFRSHWRFLAQR